MSALGLCRSLVVDRLPGFCPSPRTVRASRLFELDVDIACANRELDIAAMLRRPALLTMLGVHEDDAPRHVHGIVHSASQGRQDDRVSLYHARVVP